MSQTSLIAQQIEKHKRLRQPEDPDGLGQDAEQAFEGRDDLLYERGGLQGLRPEDGIDPAGDAMILQSHKDLGLVPSDADGFSKEHWGHSRMDSDGDNLYNRYSDDQYEAANKRYVQYHQPGVRRHPYSSLRKRRKTKGGVLDTGIQMQIGT